MRYFPGIYNLIKNKRATLILSTEGCYTINKSGYACLSLPIAITKEDLILKYRLTRKMLRGIKRKGIEISETSLHIPSLEFDQSRCVKYMDIFTPVLGITGSLYLSWIWSNEESWLVMSRAEIEQRCGIQKNHQINIENYLSSIGILDKDILNIQNMAKLAALVAVKFIESILKSNKKGQEIGAKLCDNAILIVRKYGPFCALLYIVYKKYITYTSLNLCKHKKPLGVQKFCTLSQIKDFLLKNSRERDDPLANFLPQICLDKLISCFEGIFSKKEEDMKIKDMDINKIKKDVIKRHKNSIQAQLKEKISVESLAKLWQVLLAEYHYGHAAYGLNVKEKGMLSNLIRRGMTNIPEFMEYCIANWSRIKKEFTCVNGQSRIGEYPTFTECFYMIVPILNLMSEKKVEEISMGERISIDDYLKKTRSENNLITNNQRPVVEQ